MIIVTNKENINNLISVTSCARQYLFKGMPESIDVAEFFQNLWGFIPY